MFLAGEWVPSNLLFAAAFLVAGIGVFFLGAYVIWKDRQNRRILEAHLEPELVGVQPGGGSGSVPDAAPTSTEEPTAEAH